MLVLCVCRLVPYSRYALRLAASNDVGLSEFSESSDPIQTHPTHPDHPPTDVTVTRESSTSAIVRWKVVTNFIFGGWKVVTNFMFGGWKVGTNFVWWMEGRY